MNRLLKERKSSKHRSTNKQLSGSSGYLMKRVDGSGGVVGSVCVCVWGGGGGRGGLLYHANSMGLIFFKFDRQRFYLLQKELRTGQETTGRSLSFIKFSLSVSVSSCLAPCLAILDFRT